jgi:hypothetical protein
MDPRTGRWNKTTMVVSTLLLMLGLGLAVRSMLMRFPVPVKNVERDDNDLYNHIRSRNGDKLVSSINAYKAATGLWPYALRQLVPNYTDSTNIAGWLYNWNAAGYWSLLDCSVLSGARLQFRRDRDRSGWWWTDGDSERRIHSPTKQVDDGNPMTRSKGLNERMREEFLLRIDIFPAHPVHYQGFISTLIRWKEYQQAHAIIKQCSERWPDHWWPVVTKSTVLSLQSKREEAERNLRNWILRRRCFINYCFLADFFLREKNQEGFCDALTEAARYPVMIATSDDSSDSPSFIGEQVRDAYLWWACSRAYLTSRNEFCLQMCSYWERHLEVYDRGHHANLSVLRAAAYLAMREFKRAADSLARTREYGKHSRFWADNTDELQHAIDKKDDKFRYQPCDASESLSSLITYE